jgi:hypothetical protein
MLAGGARYYELMMHYSINESRRDRTPLRGTFCDTLWRVRPAFHERGSRFSLPSLVQTCRAMISKLKNPWGGLQIEYCQLHFSSAIRSFMYEDKAKDSRHKRMKPGISLTSGFPTPEQGFQ